MADGLGDGTADGSVVGVMLGLADTDGELAGAGENVGCSEVVDT